VTQAHPDGATSLSLVSKAAFVLEITLPEAMATSGQVKRSSSHLEAADNKRPRQYYHHHHRLAEPVTLAQACEPALQDEDNVEHMMNRAIGHLLRDAGFDLADPAALSSFRGAAEECMF
jgi:hypothetical protein